MRSDSRSAGRVRRRFRLTAEATHTRADASGEILRRASADTPPPRRANPPQRGRLASRTATSWSSNDRDLSIFDRTSLTSNSLSMKSKAEWIAARSACRFPKPACFPAFPPSPHIVRWFRKGLCVVSDSVVPQQGQAGPNCAEEICPARWRGGRLAAPPRDSLQEISTRANALDRFAVSHRTDAPHGTAHLMVGVLLCAAKRSQVWSWQVP
jgi:hypothetical protein